MHIVAINARVLLLTTFYVFGLYSTGLVCSLFANSVSVAGPISQAILSSFLFGISSLLVPHWLWIAWSRILDLCQIIQLRKQMRLETTNKSGWHLCEPFQFKRHCGPLLPPIHYRPKKSDISTNKNVTAAEKTAQQLKRRYSQRSNKLRCNSAVRMRASNKSCLWETMASSLQQVDSNLPRVYGRANAGSTSCAVSMATRG